MSCKHDIVSKFVLSPRRLLIAGTGCLLMLIGAAVSSQRTRAADITYYVNEAIGVGRVTGDIVTDGTIGRLGEGHIVDYDLAVNDGISTVDLIGTSANVFANTYLTATATQLLFDFTSPSPPQEFFFSLSNRPTSSYPYLAILCYQQAMNGCVFPTASGGIAFTPDYGAPDTQLTSLSGTQVIATTTTQSTPILPVPIGPPGCRGLFRVLVAGFVVVDRCFEFILASSGAWFDPATASGYTYQMTGGSLFTNILNFPTGFTEPFDVTSPGCTIPGTFSAGQSLDFVSLCGNGVSSFTVTGIDPMFDPTNPEAFPIELAFNTPTADFVAAPLTSAVPEPWSALLLSSGMAALGLIHRRR